MQSVGRSTSPEFAKFGTGTPENGDCRENHADFGHDARLCRHALKWKLCEPARHKAYHTEWGHPRLVSLQTSGINAAHARAAVAGKTGLAREKRPALGSAPAARCVDGSFERSESRALFGFSFRSGHQPPDTFTSFGLLSDET
jgi:hypothetical protein